MGMGWALALAIFECIINSPWRKHPSYPNHWGRAKPGAAYDDKGCLDFAADNKYRVVLLGPVLLLHSYISNSKIAEVNITITLHREFPSESLVRTSHPKTRFTATSSILTRSAYLRILIYLDASNIPRSAS